MPIDVHTHYVAPELVEFLDREGGRYATRVVADADGRRWFSIKEAARRPITPRLTDLDTRVGVMDAQGVRVQVLSCPPFMLYPDVGADEALTIARLANDAMAAAVTRRPDRFAALATVPLQTPDRAAAELERAVSLGLRGAQIGTSVGSRDLDDPELEPFWAATSALGVPIALHPFDAAPVGPLGRYYLGNLVGNPTETALAASLLIFGGVLERFSGLRVVLYHAGGALGSVLGRLDHGWTVRPECRAAIPRAPSSYLGQLTIDTIAHDRATLADLVRRFGPERVVLGSDFPFDMGDERPVAAVRELDLPPDAADRILSANARSLLGLDSGRAPDRSA